MRICNPSFGLLRRRRRRRMTAGSLRFLLGALVLGTLAAAIGTSSTNSPLAQTRACQPSRAVSEGWSASFVAGCLDRKGKVAGGSQIMHLVPHKGVLFAASGYWMDKRNVWYGGKDPAAGWAQVLRLPGPGEPWEVDLNLGPQHLRPELLKSLTFRLDGNGRPLPVPDTLLIASTYVGSGNHGVSFFVRNDERGAWTTSKVINGDTGQRGENNSVRAAAVYRDRVTGLESIFLSVGILGIYAGRYDPSRPGKISWASAPEPGTTTGTRILSIVEANDSLFFSEGTRIFRRIDGPSPRYVEIANLSAEASSGTDRALFQTIGGIRGLSAIDGPVPGRQSLIFIWHPGARSSMGCVVRLDPQPDGSYARVQETCLAEQISKHLGGAPVGYVLGAYSNFMPLRDPKSNELLHVIGLEALIPATPQGRRFETLTAHNMRNDKGGFYAGAMYALRDSRGRWRVGEVNGKYRPGQPELVSIYTFALSPFSDPGQTVYLGGYDPNYFPSSDTAWVSSTDLANLVGR
jgi:poly(A) polymerase